MDDAPDPKRLVAHHAGFVRGLSRRLVHDEAAADDAAQETWLAAVRSPPTRSGRVRPWLAKVLRNVVRQQHRGQSRRDRRELVAARNDEVMSTFELAAREEMFRTLTDAVLALDEPYRRVIMLRFYEQLPPRTIATRLDVPVETVRTRIKRGLAQLRAGLDDRSEGGRRAWIAALLPFAGPALPPVAPPAPLPGKVVAAGAALSLAAVAGFVLWSASPPPSATTDTAQHESTTPPTLRVPGARPVVAAASPDVTPRATPAPVPDRLQGRISSVRGGAVANASVEVHPGTTPFGDRMPNSTDMLESMTSAPVPTARVRTNEEGRFSVRELPNGPWVLVVRAPGFQLTAQHIVMTDVGPAGPPVDVRLVPRAPLHGRVVDEDGRGLEGARVALLVPARTVSAFFARHFEATDADGRFVLRTPPPPGPAQLVVLAKGYPALLRVVESSEPLRIVRRRDAEIRVVALDEHGRPVAGAHVAVVMGEEQDGPRAPQAVAHGRTDAAGVLVLPGRAGPVLAVLFDHPAHVRAVVSPHMPPSMPRAMEVAGMSEQGVRAGTNAWTLRLQPTVEVSGRVATEAGAPVADAVCHAFGPMGPVMTATSDAKGRYTLRMPRGMPAMVVVQAEGWLQQDGSVRVAAPGGSTEHATHDVVMLPAVRISGRVVDAGGQPLHGVQVRLVGTDPNNYDGLPGTPHPVTDAKGRYRFDTVRPGRRLHVEVRQRGRVGSQSAAFTLGEVAAHEIEDIVLRRGRSLDVTVVNEAGDPIEGAQVVPASVQGPDGAGLDEAALGRLITDAQGRARTPPLPEGAVVVTTYARGHAPKRQQVEVASVRGALRVRLQPGREMRGTILDADGQPLAGAMVTVRSSSPEGLPPYGALTDGKGHFVVGDLPPDVPLRVTVRHPTHERLEIDAAALEHELRLVARDDADPRTEADLQKEAHELQRRWVASQTDAERQVIEREMRDVMEALEALYVGAEEAR